MSATRGVYEIEPVMRFRHKDQDIYFGTMASDLLSSVLKVMDYTQPNGYQRPAKPKRFSQYAEYLKQPEGYVTPIIINGSGQWEFQPSDGGNPDVGRLLIKGHGTVLDGQHRKGGLELYSGDSGEVVPVPFVAFANLALPSEIRLFDIINSTMQRLPTSLIRWNERGDDENTQIAIELERQEDSPFYASISISGSRDANRKVSLEGMRRATSSIFGSGRLSQLPLNEKVRLVKSFWQIIKELFPEEWEDTRSFRIRHLIGVSALSVLARDVLSECYDWDKNYLDTQRLRSLLEPLRSFDWHKHSDDLGHASGFGGREPVAKRLSELVYGSVAAS